jgi:hypothetical protein
MNEYRRILGVSSIQPGLSTAMWTDRYSSCNSPYRYGAWTISSSLGFNEGALRMASEDSDCAVHSALEDVVVEACHDSAERCAAGLSC